MSERASDRESSPGGAAGAGAPAPSAAPRVLVFTATYNERDNIEELVRRVRAVDAAFDLLIVDDDSPDGTGTVLDALVVREPRLTVIHRPRKLGLGSAHKLAMLHAIRAGYDTLVTMDADLSHSPEYLPKLLAELERHDFVIGSRYVGGARTDYTGYRLAVSRLANWSARALLGIRLHEFTNAYRAYRVAALRRVDISKIRAQGYSFFLESLFAISRSGLSCAEIPIHFQDRKAGQSKIPRLEILWGMKKLLKLVAVRAFRRGTHSQQSGRLDASCAACHSPYVIEQGGDVAPAKREQPASHDRRACDQQVIACLHCGALSLVP
ncbi:MAG: polyprenol monophosphomannose synthase [Planctomycetes bacterium]|nr:polyprenol monophosphomannose synthase [Planctomycetota bacterium]